MKGLSKRLELIASLVPYGARVCDIGTDHCLLGIELISRKKAVSVIASDINEKPLEFARKNLERQKILGIELRLCDGFCGIEKNEFDTAVIAGMGGEVIAGIIGKSGYSLENKTLILQPTTSPEFLRKFLCENGFYTETEIPISENGKVYSVMKCRFSGEKSKCEESYYFTGLVSSDTADGKLYLKKQFDRCNKTAKALKNIPEKRDEYNYYSRICDGIKKSGEKDGV